MISIIGQLKWLFYFQKYEGGIFMQSKKNNKKRKGKLTLENLTVNELYSLLTGSKSKGKMWKLMDWKTKAIYILGIAIMVIGTVLVFAEFWSYDSIFDAKPSVIAVFVFTLTFPINMIQMALKNNEERIKTVIEHKKYKEQPRKR